MITKNIVFVILIVSCVWISASCSHLGFGQSRVERSEDEISRFYGEPKVIGKIRSKKINESSGLAVTECNPEVVWTLNDSGNPNEIYALTKTGRLLSTWKITGAKNRDWEAMAPYRDKDGNCYLYVADIGDNEKKHESLKIYSVQEPDPKGRTGFTEKARFIEFEYPDGKHDAEAMFVHPKTKDKYVITKELSKERAGVYRVRPGETKKVGSISLPSFPKAAVTGASISSDGSRVIVSDYLGAYEFVLPDDAENFDDIWKQKPLFVEVGFREQGEAITYTQRTKGVITTSEKKDSPINYVERSR